MISLPLRLVLNRLWPSYCLYVNVDYTASLVVLLLCRDFLLGWLSLFYRVIAFLGHLLVVTIVVGECLVSTVVVAGQTTVSAEHQCGPCVPSNKMCLRCSCCLAVVCW